MSAFNKHRRQELYSDRGKLLLFLIWPLGTLYLAVRNFHIKPYRKYILFFGILYGLTFMPVSDSDGERHAQYFENQKVYSLEDYIDNITHFYGSNSTYQDIYVYSLYYWIGLFSSSVKVFHMVVAFIYFSVYLSLLGFVFDFVTQKDNKPIIWFFVGLAFLSNLSDGLNGIRWPLATMVFLLGSFKLIITNERKYLFLAAIAPLIHFAMAYQLIFLLIFYFTKRFYRPIYAYSFVIFAIAASAIFSGFIQGNVSLLGEKYETKVVGYTTNEAYKAGRELHVQAWNWYVQLNSFATYYFAILSLVILSLFRKKFTWDDKARRLEYVSYIFLAASILSGGMVDSISNRYSVMVVAVVLFLLFYMSGPNRDNSLLKKLKLIYIPLLIIHVLVIFRGDLYTVSPVLIFGNPVVMFFYQATESIQTFFLG